MKINSKKKLWLLAFSIAMLVGAVTPAETQARGYPPWNIVERLIYANKTYARGHFDAAIAAVVKTGLAEAIATQRLTVFAPTDRAFAELGLTADIINDLDPEVDADEIENLRFVLLYHATPGRVSPWGLKRRPTLPMLNEQTVKVAFKYHRPLLVAANSDARICYGVPAKNGNLYFIDDVLLPDDDNGEVDEIE